MVAQMICLLRLERAGDTHPVNDQCKADIRKSLPICLYTLIGTPPTTYIATETSTVVRTYRSTSITTFVRTSITTCYSIQEGICSD